MKQAASASFFSNTQCPYFPCHATKEPENFNCLFCYCPLYTLGAYCGGAFSYTANGIKDCSACLLPHQPDSADMIRDKFSSLAKLAAENR